MIKRVSLKDIANKVGVSTALVSYVLSGQEKKKKVSRELADKIRKAASEMNYQPNEIARSLRKGSTKTIGMVIADISNPFFSHLARYVENEAMKYGYTVIMGSSDEEVGKSEILISTLLKRQVDGFIISPAEGTESQIQKIIEEKVPLVLIDRFFPGIATNSVILDNYQSTYEATTFLINKGYRNIAIVVYKTSLIHMKERVRGYYEAMMHSDLAGNINIIRINALNTHKEIETTCYNSIINDRKIEAIIFTTNLLSISGLFCIHEHKIKIPDDLAFIGFDGGDCFDLFYSPITFVKQPIEEMGKDAVRVLIDAIKNNSNKNTQIVHKPELIIRNSC